MANISDLITLQRYQEQMAQARSEKENRPYLQGIMAQGQPKGPGGIAVPQTQEEQLKDLLQFSSSAGLHPAVTEQYANLIKGTVPAGASPVDKQRSLIQLTNIGLEGKGGAYDALVNPITGEVVKSFPSVASPTSGANVRDQFVGRTQDGTNAIVFKPDTGKVELIPMPEAAQAGILPKTDKFAAASETKELAGTEVLKKQLDFIDERYKPEYVGLIDQFTGSATAYFDGDEASFRRTVSDMGDTLLRLKSGAQINEQEYARLMKIIPNFSMGEAQFKANVKDFRRTLELILSERKKAMQAGGVVERGRPDMKDFTDLSDSDLLEGF